MRLRVTIVAGLATLLASVGMYPLFVSGGWFWGGMGATVVAGTAGLFARRFRLPPVINLLAGLAGLLLYLTVLYASQEALFGVIPTPRSVARLGELLGDGWGAINRYAAPVPLVPEISLLAVLGIGLIAVLVDLLAVRLGRAAPAGLPLLAMYSVPAAVRDGSIGWIAFLLAAGGYLALLLADARDQVTGWGRPVFTPHWSDDAPRERPDSSALALTGRKIGLTAVVVAVLLPMLVPGIRPRGLFGMGGVGKGGVTTILTPDPLVSLKRELVRADETAILSYRTDDNAYPDYLRMYALDRFDGDSWTYSTLRGTKENRLQDQELPIPQGLVSASARAVNTTITIDRNVRGMNFLPAPYPPTRVSIKGDWRVDASTLMIYSLHDAAGGRTYTVNSLRVQPTAEQLAAGDEESPEVSGRYLQVPAGIPAEVRALAGQVTRGAANPYAKAVKLQSWFTKPGNFHYSLEVPPPKDVSALHRFLLVDRTGYCEQFAASMALLARIAGIPARVAMGYTAGVRGKNGEWVVRTRDTHAWPELYFQGAGWLRFEPTPSGTLGQGTATVPAYSLSGSGSNGPGSTGPTSSSLPPLQPGGPSSGPNASGVRGLDANGAGTTRRPPSDARSAMSTGIVIVLVVLLLAAAPLIGRQLIRWRRWAGVRAGPSAAPPQVEQQRPHGGGGSPGDRPHLLRPRRSGAVDEAAVALAAWAELRSDAIDHGLPWQYTESPRAAARRLRPYVEPGGSVATEALERLAHAAERARYAESPDLGEAVSTSRRDVHTVRKAFVAAVSRRARWRARLLPPSTMAELRRAGGRALEVFDWLDVVVARAGRVFARR